MLTMSPPHITNQKSHPLPNLIRRRRHDRGGVHRLVQNGIEQRQHFFFLKRVSVTLRFVVLSSTQRKVLLSQPKENMTSVYKGCGMTPALCRPIKKNYAGP